jgi:hypothetical protein
MDACMGMIWGKALVTATVSTCEVKGQTRWTKACGCACPGALQKG